MLDQFFVQVPGHQDYLVDVAGRVFSTRSGELHQLRPTRTSKGYLTVKLYTAARIAKNFKVHRLVARAFIGMSDLQINHRNGIKTDNRPTNLEYCTAAQNMQHAYATQLVRAACGERHGHSKLSEREVKAIRLLAGMFPQKQLAELFAINQSRISRIQNLKGWTHAG